ncbi:small multi-drug export protein [candidate division WOR-3 bacterium]|nr:small multi-drug export protein [candidate division WOR-3 bacterium]
MVQKKNRFALTGLLIILVIPSIIRAVGNTVHSAVSSSTDSTLEALIDHEDTLLAAKGTKKPGLSERIAAWMYDHNLDPRLVAFLMSILPISELRGAVLIGIPTYQGPWWHISLIALLGNLLPVIPILFLLDLVMRLLGKIRFFKRIFDWLLARARREGGLIERYEYLGVFLFVAIPLPFTGAWTGSLIASVLRMNPWKSFATVCVGVVTADIIVTSFVLLGWWGLLAAAIVLPCLWGLSKWLERRPKKVGAERKKR